MQGITNSGGMAAYKANQAMIKADEAMEGAGFRRPSQNYALGDITFIQLSATKRQKLVCVQAGTTASGDLTLASMAEGSITTDGTVVWAVDSLADGNYSAGHQNGIYREADLTAYWDSGIMSTNIEAGKFVNIYPGDMLTKTVTVPAITYEDSSGNTVTYKEQSTYMNHVFVVGECNYMLLRGGDSVEYWTVKNHVLLFSKKHMGNVVMNLTDTTEGGYVGSFMWKNAIPRYADAIKNVFGEKHVLKHKLRLSNSVNGAKPFMAYTGMNGIASSMLLVDVDVNLMNSVMVRGCRTSSSIFDSFEANSQIAAFRHNASLGSTSGGFFLVDVGGTGHFMSGSSWGEITFIPPTTSYGAVRIYFLIC